jgi:hypothetical protein
MGLLGGVVTRQVAAGSASVLLAAACGLGSATGPCAAPVVRGSTIAANPHNVLSAVVSAQVDSADSVVVRFGSAGGALDSVAPAVVPTIGTVVVPVLGLLPDHDYFLSLTAYGCRTANGPQLGIRTGSLPADLPIYSAGGPDPSPGYVEFAAGAFGLAIDNTGRVVWYHRFPNGPGLNFQAQPTGRYAARPPGGAPGADWVEIDPLGNITGTLGCQRGLPSRFHDLIARSDSSYWVMCDETRTMDLSAAGGVAGAQVTGTTVQHVSAAGLLLFEWSPFDHFDISDLDPADRAGPLVNWTHGNALDLDADGNLLISFRSLSEITKIDTHTGQVRWRMGGSRNQFTFQNVATPAFVRQHGLRVTGPHQFGLLDNLGDPTGSRAERYECDEGPGGLTVRLLASLAPEVATVAQLGGSTQSLPEGHTLVAYGNGDRVEEYDGSARVVWRIEGNSGYVFRAQRIRSLYRPGVGEPR